MPLLVLSGEKAGGTSLIEQARMIATNVRGEIVNWHRHHASLHGRPPISRVLAGDNLVRLHN